MIRAATPGSRTCLPTVCQLVHSLNVGGAELLAARIARRLRDRFRMVFVCLDDPGTAAAALRSEGFPVHCVERRPGLDLRCAGRLAQVLREERVELIHAHQYTPFTQALMSRLVYRRPRVLFTEHGRHHPDLRKRRRVVFNRLLLGRADRVVGVGASVREALIQNEGIPASRVEVLYNGIDLAPFECRDAGSLGGVRAELGADGRDFVVMQVARLHHLKDHATAIRAVKRLRRDGVPVRLAIVGDGEERQRLERLARDAGVAQATHFLGTRGDVPRLWTAADAALLTSISEGIPLTVIEAMAAGRPVVATSVGGLPEMIEDGVHGFLAAAGDDAALAKRLRRLYEDPALCARMGDAARHRAVEGFSEERMLAEYEARYREMLP